MMFSTISGVVFFPTSVQSGPAWKSKWMPRKLSARFSRWGESAANVVKGREAMRRNVKRRQGRNAVRFRIRVDVGQITRRSSSLQNADQEISAGMEHANVVLSRAEQRFPLNICAHAARAIYRAP